jgi:acyl dehydratase
MKSGDALPPLTRLIDAGAMAIMADVLRDPNPIHLDPRAVAAAGLGDRRINQGPANLGYVIDMLAAAFPGHKIEKLTSRYLANVREGELVTAGGCVRRLEGDRVECDAWLKSEDGTVAVAVVAAMVERTE